MRAALLDGLCDGVMGDSNSEDVAVFVAALELESYATGVSVWVCGCVGVNILESLRVFGTGRCLMYSCYERSKTPMRPNIP